jgi:anti-anti-sigma factor
MEVSVALIRASAGAVFIGSDDRGNVVLTPVGELDMAFAPTVLAAIRAAIAATSRAVVLDFSCLTFLDSGGCDMLARARREALAAGVTVARREEMVRVVRHVLAITSLLAAFPADCRVDRIPRVGR